MAYGRDDGFYNPEVEDFRATGAGIPPNPAGAAISGNPYNASNPPPGGFYTDSPGPMFNNQGQRTMAQPSQEEVYKMFRAQNAAPGQNFDSLRNFFGSYGYDAQPFMYGNTPSGNELLINGEKRKFISGGDIGQNNAGWYDWGTDDSAPGGAAAGGGGSSFSASVLPGLAKAGANYAAGSDANMGSIWSQLMQRATQGTDVDTRSGPFRQIADRYAAQVERSRRNAIADNAEKMSAQMLGGSGAQAVANRGINAEAGQKAGMFEANLVQREIDNKRQEISQALQLASANGNAEQQRKLTQELAQLDAQMRAMGIESGERIANNNLGFNYSNLEANQNNIAANAIANAGLYR